LAEATSGLDVLLLFGSRGRGDAHAGGLLRHRAARDGQVVFEARPRLAEQFRLDASQFWCDAAYMPRHGYDEVLEELPR
jgi:hypothetical protein